MDIWLLLEKKNQVLAPFSKILFKITQDQRLLIATPKNVMKFYVNIHNHLLQKAKLFRDLMYKFISGCVLPKERSDTDVF